MLVANQIAPVSVAGAASSPPTGMLLWFKADALGLSDGAAVSSWTDSSGNGNSATQGTGGSQPVFKTSIVNGKPIVRFAGSQFLLTGSVSIGGQYTLLAVADSTGGSFPQSILDFDSGLRMFQYRFDVLNDFQLIAFNTAVTTFVPTKSVTSSSFNIMTGLNGASSAQCFVNGSAGTPVTTSGTMQSGSQPFELGGHGGSTGQGLVGDIAEAIVYNSALSTADRQQAESYLSGKYGIAGPAGVPTPSTSAPLAYQAVARAAIN